MPYHRPSLYHIYQTQIRTSKMMSDDVKKAAQAFYDEFQQQKKEFLTQLETLPQQTDQRQKKLNSLKQNLILLEKQVTDAAIYLPQYDQRQFATQLKEIQTLIAKNSSAKPKFSFKKAKAVTTSSIITASQQQQQQEELSRQPLDDEKAKFEVPSNALYVHNLSNQIVVLDNSGNDTYRDVYLESLDHCIVFVRAPRVSSLHIRCMRSTIIIAGPVRGSALIQDCVDVILSFGCRQFRCHDSKNVDVYLFASSAPIIEDCTGFRFAPYLYPLPNKEHEFVSAELNLSENQFCNVQDFKWLKTQASPNWKILPEENRIQKDQWDEISSASHSREGELETVLSKYLPTVTAL